MSDEPWAVLDSFLQWKLGIESPSLKYAAKAVAKTKTILFAVNIPYPLLRAWRELKMKSPIQLSSVSNMDIDKYTYIELLEYSILGNSFAITPDKVIRSRINNPIRILASKVCGEYDRLKGRKRKELDAKTKLFHIFEGETASVKDIYI